MINKIEILPVSIDDDRIRMELFRRIYMEPLGNYGIHIIVKHGDVALYGTVSSEADKTKAGMDARSVFGVHSVDNEIQVVRD